jgi:hypothetical protein
MKILIYFICSSFVFPLFNRIYNCRFYQINLYSQRLFLNAEKFADSVACSKHRFLSVVVCGDVFLLLFSRFEVSNSGTVFRHRACF